MTTQTALDTSRQATDDSILDRIIAETRLSPEDEAYGIARRGVSAFIEELLKPHNQQQPVKKAMVDRMIAEIDSKLSQQMDEILHHPSFSPESAWRGLKLLVDRTDFRENTRIELINASSRICWRISRTVPISSNPACTSTSTPPSTASSAASRWAP